MKQKQMEQYQVSDLPEEGKSRIALKSSPGKLVFFKEAALGEQRGFAVVLPRTGSQLLLCESQTVSAKQSSVCFLCS